ncbi:hypothetical protein [Nannocystis pusilla]|nr:hypothetical protein [Nannocystis pusilla]
MPRLAVVGDAVVVMPALRGSRPASEIVGPRPQEGAQSRPQVR